jgi:hypothetical protein
MSRITAVGVFLLCMTLAMGAVWPEAAGALRQSAVTQYQGRIAALKIATCGLAPGVV